MWRSIELGMLLGTLACAQVPRNLDFREGEPGKTPAYWSVNRASAETRQEGCAPGAACAVIASGEISQTIDATLYRGKPIRVSAWLRNGAQLWLRVDGPAKTSNLFNNLADKPVRSDAWALSELSLFIDRNAESIEFGVTATGAGPAWVRDVSLEPEDSAPFIPRNLDFAGGEADQPPAGWYVFPDSAGYKAVATRDGCQAGPSCGILFAPPQTPDGGHGAIVQTVDATQYRGKTVRLRAWVKLSSSGPDDVAYLFIQDRNDVRAREIRGGDWAEYDAIRSIDRESSTMSFGLTLSGTGSARIDGVLVDIVPDGQQPSLSIAPIGKENVALAAAATPAAGQPSPGTGAPSIEEVRANINSAARIALAWDKSLPDFICTQDIRRSESADGKNWKTDDTLNVQLGSAGGKELHKLVSVNDKPATVSYESVRGASSQGEFGGFLGEIFRPGAASFWWDSDTTVRGHAVRVYRYEVTPPKSQFTLSFPATQWSAVVGHHGLLYIDRESGQVLRLIQIAYVPKDAPLRGSSETIDSDYVDVGGMQYLLPIRADVMLTTDAARFHNEIEFRDYRKFTAEASVAFDEPGAK